MTVNAASFAMPSGRTWTGSARRQVRTVPIDKAKATRVFHKALKRINVDQAQRADLKPSRRRSPPHSVERVLRALIFDFLNFKTGKLEPGYLRIAKYAGCSVRTVARAIRYLRRLKIIGWVRRCYAWINEQGRYQIDQDTNSYWLNDPSQWSSELEEPPTPVQDSLGLVLPRPRILNPEPGDTPANWQASLPVGTTLEDVALSLDTLASLNEAANRTGLSAIRARQQRRRAAEARAVGAIVAFLLELTTARTVH